MGFSFSNSFFTPFVSLLAFLSFHSVIPTVLLFDSCLLGLFWAYCMFSLYLIPMAWYYHWASIHAVLGLLGPFHRFWGFLSPFISLGILGPFHFLGNPRPIPVLHSHGLLLSLLGFPNLNYHILYFWGLWAFPPTPYSLNSLLWASLAHTCLLSISHNTMSLLFLSLDSFEALLLFLRPIIHYSCHSDLMVFILNLLTLSLPYCWVSSYYWASLPKWVSTEINPSISFYIFLSM